MTLLSDTNAEAEELFAALTEIPHQLTFCHPNADAGSRDLSKRIRFFLAHRGSGRLFVNLPAVDYWSLLRHADLLVGNSSSGIMESASFGAGYRRPASGERDSCYAQSWPVRIGRMAPVLHSRIQLPALGDQLRFGLRPDATYPGNSCVRERVARMYEALLGDVATLVLPPTEVTGMRLSWFVYVVRLADTFSQDQRDAIARMLHQRGIGCGRYFAPIHTQPAYADLPLRRALPVTESISRRTLALPFFNRLRR